MTFCWFVIVCSLLIVYHIFSTNVRFRLDYYTNYDLDNLNISDAFEFLEITLEQFSKEFGEYRYVYDDNVNFSPFKCPSYWFDSNDLLEASPSIGIWTDPITHHWFMTVAVVFYDIR
jgi:hypothetical protein